MCMRSLAGRPQCQLAGDALEVGDAATRLHGRRVHPRVDDVFSDDHVGFREHGLGRGFVAGLPVEAVVVLLALEVIADHRGVRCKCLPDVDHRGEDVVLHVDQFEGIARCVPVLGDDERNLLALEAHFVGGEYGLDVVRQRRHPGEALRGEVGAGDDGLHLRVGLRGADVDLDDAGVRDG